MIESMRAARYVPALALMALIYLLSAQPDLGTGLGVWDTVLRKLAHAAEYGLLFLLWVFALRGRPRRRTLAAAIAVLYAVTDELHQTTVEGRHGTPVDVLIDATGVALAALALHVRRRRRVRVPHAPDRARPAPADARGAA